MKKRKYQQTARAEQSRETRRQIVEATVRLHEALGPAHTSIKAIAEEAGVQRLTVYRHFPDEESLFQACTSHWLSQHPPPPVTEAADPQTATEKTLLAVYRYYRQTERMWTVAYRDVEQVEALHAPMAQVEAYFDGMRDALLAAWQQGKAQKKPLSATLRHALRFATWQSLRQERLSDKKMTELVMSWLRCC